MNSTILSWAGHTMGFDPQVEALLHYLLMKVFDALGKRRGLLEYGRTAMFSSNNNNSNKKPAAKASSMLKKLKGKAL
jgi:hypothetical protein